MMMVLMRGGGDLSKGRRNVGSRLLWLLWLWRKRNKTGVVAGVVLGERWRGRVHIQCTILSNHLIVTRNDSSAIDADESEGRDVVFIEEDLTRPHDVDVGAILGQPHRSHAEHRRDSTVGSLQMRKKLIPHLHQCAWILHQFEGSHRQQQFFLNAEKYI